MLDHFIAKNSTAHKVNSYCTLAISYYTFCVGKHTILGPAALSIPATMVPHCPLLQCPPLPNRADLSTPANSIPATWCRIVHSCIFHTSVFDRATLTTPTNSINPFDRGLTHLVHAQLHWLDIPDRVSYKIATMVYQCIHGQAPQSSVLAVHRSPTLPLDAISALPGAICSPFNVIGSTLRAVGHSRSLLQRPGIHCQTVCTIQHWVSFDCFRQQLKKTLCSDR